MESDVDTGKYMQPSAKGARCIPMVDKTNGRRMYSSSSLSMATSKPTYKNKNKKRVNKAKAFSLLLYCKFSCSHKMKRRKLLLAALVVAAVLYVLPLLRLGRYKISNYLFDHGYIPCSTLRKEPILFVIDTEHVQVVWEANCGFRQDDIVVEWHLDDGVPRQSNPIEPIILDKYHKVYKAILGPLDHGGTWTYAIKALRRSTGKSRTLRQHSFQWHSSSAQPPSSGNIRIAGIADNQFGLKTFSQLTKTLAKQHLPINYLIHAGDAVQNEPSKQQWQTDFYAPLTDYGLAQRSPIIYAHGNHDMDPRLTYTYTRNPDPHHPSTPWFSFTLQDNQIRIIVLDSNLDTPSQDTWLEEQLANPPKTSSGAPPTFTLVIVHIPPFMEFWDPEPWFNKHESEWGRFVRDRFVPLFEQYKVDLVISGHQHNYQRGQRNGVHYAIIGGAGGDLDFERVAEWHMYDVVVGNWHFVIMDIEVDHRGGSLRWEMWDVAGRKRDEFVLSK